MTPVTNSTIALPLIISGSISGDHRMQQLLYQQFAAKMYKLCFRYTKNAADAEDILQEGFIKIFRNLDKFRGDGFFEGWLRKIMIRTAISHFRNNVKKINTHNTEFNYSVEDKENNIFDKLAEKDIVVIVKKLSPGYRKVFTMYVIEGYNHKEIAGILGCSEGNCKSQLNRSRTQLQKMLKRTA
jgi:RNA polymerase sigma factor (sigma-70 family)